MFPFIWGPNVVNNNVTVVYIYIDTKCWGTSNFYVFTTKNCLTVIRKILTTLFFIKTVKWKHCVTSDLIWRTFGHQVLLSHKREQKKANIHEACHLNSRKCLSFPVSQMMRWFHCCYSKKRVSPCQKQKERVREEK